MPNATIAMLRNMLASLDDAKKYQSLRDVMSTMNAADLAAVFEDLPPEKMPVLFRLCPKDLAADVFAELSPETQQALINGLTDRELKVVVEELCADDAADLVEEMPASVVKRILAQAEPDTRKMINELLKYPEDSAGGVMTTEFMELSPDWTVRRAMQAIRANGIDKETINNCYVTQSDRTLVGVVSLRTLVLEKDEDRRIDDLMDTGVISVTTGTDREQTSQMFEKYGFLAIPVVDGENRLVGIVTIDDAISILQDEASEDFAKMNAIAPTDKPYFKRTLSDLYKSRAPWLLFLLVSSSFSSLVIRKYEDALAVVTVLTAYIPMLTDTGGNAGSQSTSTIIRGMAVGELRPHDLPRILWRECRVALLCGLTLALCNFVKLLVLDRVGLMVAAVVCLTLVVTVVLSQLLGAALPALAEKIGIDPAVMASPLITTIVDTTTLLVYFNIARVLLHL
ncbi:magnesium transporter [bacterium]|uniref:magnesium transporter n=1 Tax=Gemmiger sp. TaxID=2049027 RepID=UPI002A7FEEDF|nr:magnesium transporter [Gemmiger sp.]MCI6082954.1 magnesium transporter [bacterium]MCI6248616.1 magnesium transporter [bacterium]MCI6520435.1 magnesium transporter [bacterium]MCI6884622.1 magnesium transporter [bacterium]MCI7192393.1 magnesium transporter [bacterium]